MQDDIVIVSAARTPVGAFNGAFANLPAHELGKIAIQAALTRAGVEGARVSEVIMGCVLPAGLGQVAGGCAWVRRGPEARAGRRGGRGGLGHRIVSGQCVAQRAQRIEGA